MNKEPQNNLFGPMTNLIGTWSGNKGIDMAPEPDGLDENKYYETIVFMPVDDEIENAEEQNLVALHYHKIVRRLSNDNVFHDETGYFMWDKSSHTIIHSLVIPRGVGLIAGGSCTMDNEQESEITFSVSAGAHNIEWPIMQSPFMLEKAKTTAFEHKMSFSRQKLSYAHTTTIEIYGREFQHTDQNVLTKSGI